MIKDLLQRLHIEQYISPDDQKILDNRVMTLAAWNVLNTLCQVRAASEQFRSQEDGQIIDERRLQRIQVLYLKEINRINSLLSLGIGVESTVRETELHQKRSQVRGEIQGRWRSMGEHLSKGEFWLQMRDLFMGELRQSPVAVQSFRDIQASFSHMGDEVHPTIHALLSELQHDGIDIDENQAFLASLWQEHLMVQLPARPDEVPQLLSDLHDVFSSFLETNSDVLNIVKPVAQDERPLESAQYIQMMTVRDLEAIMEMLGDERYTNRDQITAILLQSLAQRYNLTLPELNLATMSASLRAYRQEFAQHHIQTCEQYMLFLSEYQASQPENIENDQEDIFKRRIPRPRTQQYIEHIQRLAARGIQFVRERSVAEHVFLPDPLSDSLVPDAQLERVVSGAMRYDNLLKTLLTPVLRGSVAQWSVSQVYAASIIVKLERHATGKNGFQNIDKSKFVEDLLGAIQAELE